MSSLENATGEIAATGRRNEVAQPDGGNGPRTLEANAWLAAIIDNSDDAILSKSLDGVISSWNPGAERIFGWTAEEAIGRSITLIIPDDRLAEEDMIIGKIEAGQRVDSFETVRRRKDGSLIDVAVTVSPVRDHAGQVQGASKIARDITEAKRNLERQSLVLREMNHRIKNLFALATGLISLSARSAADAEELACNLAERMQALARAHELTLPDLSRDAEAAVSTTLRALVEAVLAPYQGGAAQIGIEGEDAPVGARALPSLALMLHEFATNAAKYGALSSNAGQLTISITRDADMARLEWSEVSTAHIVEAPSAEGFGSKLERSSLRALGAAIERDWRRDGLTIRLAVPLRQLEA